MSFEQLEMQSLLPGSDLRGNRYLFATMSQKAQFTGQVKRLIIEEGGDPRRIEVEFGTANIWYNSIKFGSGSPRHLRAAIEKAGWVHLGTLALQIGGSEESVFLWLGLRPGALTASHDQDQKECEGQSPWPEGLPQVALSLALSRALEGSPLGLLAVLSSSIGWTSLRVGGGGVESSYLSPRCFTGPTQVHRSEQYPRGASPNYYLSVGDLATARASPCRSYQTKNGPLHRPLP